MQLKEFVTQNWISIPAMMLAIASFIYAVRIRHKSRYERMPTFAVDNTRTPILSAERVAEAPITVVKKDNGKQVMSDLTAIRFYFWNDGRKPMKTENILDPIRIRLGDAEASILDYKVLKRYREITNLRLVADLANPSKALLIDFSILEKNDGAACQIIFEGSPKTEIIVSGVIEEAGEILTLKERAFGHGWFDIIYFALCFIAGVVGISGAIWVSFGPPFFKSSMAFSVIAPVIMIYSGLLLGFAVGSLWAIKYPRGKIPPHIIP